MRSGEVFGGWKMSYRYNQLENVLRDQYETATAELEKLAEDVNSVDGFERLDGSLADLGFKKEILTEKDRNSAVVYVRKNDSGLEVLADSDLAISDRTGKLHLYQIPAGQNVQEWYSSIPDPIGWFSENNSKTAGRSMALIFGGMIVGAAVGFFTGNSAGAMVIFSSSTFLGGGYLGTAIDKNSLSDQTVAKGPKALRHIANTSFEDFVKYQYLRIEGQEMISLEQSQEAELYALAKDEAELIARGIK